MASRAALVSRSPDVGVTRTQGVVADYGRAALTLHSYAPHQGNRGARWRPELVTVENFGPRSCRAALNRRMRSKGRLLVCVTRPPTGPEWLTRLVLRSADAVVADGDEAVSSVLRLSGFGPRLFAIPEADRASLGPFLECPPSRTAQNAHRLVFADELAPWSGAADFLISAMGWADRNRNRTLDICWIGDGVLTDVLKAQPVPRNLSQRFVGRLDAPESANVFAESGILVASSGFGHAPNPVLQAMAAALPVLGSTHCRRVRSLVRHAETGWVFDPVMPGAMSEALSQALATSPETLNQMRRTARSEVEAASAPTMLERVRHAVERLLDSHDPGGMLGWKPL